MLVGFALAPLSGWLHLDRLVAILVGLNLLWTGYSRVHKPVGIVMEVAKNPGEVVELRQVILRHADRGTESSDMQTATSGSVTFIEFHLVVPADMTAQDAHAICERLEQALRGPTGEAIPNIHIQPEREARHSGVPVI